MPKFSEISSDRLMTCHPRLRLIAVEAIKVMDFAVSVGYRDKHDQDVAFNSVPQRSKEPWPKSKHNTMPSLAIDIAPYPVSFNDDPRNIMRFCILAGVWKAVAYELNIPLRWGGDWDGYDKESWDPRENVSKLSDWGHFELVNPI